MHFEHCSVCKNYDDTLDDCKTCQYEPDEKKLFAKDNWDILNLNDDLGWSHIQILERLHQKNIDCIFVDIWTNDGIAYLVGCNAKNYKIANALGIHEQVIYNDYDHCFVILNLFQEKCLRGLIK